MKTTKEQRHKIIGGVPQRHERLTDWSEVKWGEVKDLLDDFDSLEKANGVLREALEFYADRENWKRWYPKEGDEENRHFPANATLFQGGDARIALSAASEILGEK